MSTQNKHIDRLKKLKKFGYKLKIDARKSNRLLTRGEKSRITRAFNKMGGDDRHESVLNVWHVRKSVSLHAAKRLEEFGFKRQGKAVWIRKEDSKRSELLKISVRTDKKGVVRIFKTFEGGKTTITGAPELLDLDEYNRSVFDNIPLGYAITGKIGDAHQWTSTFFRSHEEFLLYKSQLYNMIATRDERELALVTAQLDPLLTAVKIDMLGL